MKKWLVELTEKDFSKMPVIVGFTGFVLAVLAVVAMVFISQGIALLGLGEVVPIWLLQVVTMSPWIAFMSVLALAVVALIGLMILDISVHKNFDEYKELMKQPWRNERNKDSNPAELSEEIFGSTN